MQLVNLTLRLGGSLLHTVPKNGVSPAEVLILKAIHGSDAVTDIRPAGTDRTRRQDAEWSRLSELYDRSSSLQAPGEGGSTSLMASLFPGAMRKLPTTLKEIGLGHLAAPSDKTPPQAVPPVVDQDDDMTDEEKAAAEEAEAAEAEEAARAALEAAE